MKLFGPPKAHVRSLLEVRAWQRPNHEQTMLAFAQYRPQMVENARAASLKGINWRPEKPVKIGCCLLACDGRGNFSCDFIGWNSTPRPLSEQQKEYFKPCAEKNSILKCLNAGWLPLAAVVYTNHNQPDDVTGLQRKVFCPCAYCVWWKQAIFIPPTFVIDSVCPTSDGGLINEAFTLEEWARLHEEAMRGPRPTLTIVT
jgi:hypothetical protein